MRYALLSDVHANLHALLAVFDALRKVRVDRYICSGDLVGYGPLPNECVELLASVDAVCVAGNHDLIATGRLADDRCTRFARESLSWTRHALNDDSHRFLQALPERASLPAVTIAHGSLNDPFEYVTRPERANEQLDLVEQQDPQVRILVLGHTHRPWAHEHRRGTRLRKAPGSVDLNQGARYLLNPGSVGQPRDQLPHARFAVLDLDAQRADFHSVPFDLQACREALRRQHLPLGSCYAPPPRFERARDALQRLRDQVQR